MKAGALDLRPVLVPEPLLQRRAIEMIRSGSHC
jgi:hypothetical protein